MSSNKKILFTFLLLVLFVPLLQMNLSFVELKPLKGVFTLTEKPDSIEKNWFSKNYQTRYDNYFNNHLGFRNFLVRLNNQIGFSCFRKVNAYGLILGKDGYTFGEGYIMNSYTGNDFLGKKKINELLLETKKIQDELKNNYNIDLIIVYAPSKEFILPEYLPEQYQNINRSTTNIEYFLKESKKLNINFIDFNKFFLILKDTCKYPTFYKQSEHWTQYTMSLAADSLIKYLEKIRGVDLPDVKISHLCKSDSTRFVDYDQGDAMNLLFKLKQNNVVYPKFIFDSKGKTKIKVLSIADCYFQQIYQSTIADSCLDINSDFWFYNKESQSKTKGYCSIDKIDKRKILLNQDVIIISHTNHTLNQFSFGFIDEFESLIDTTKRKLLLNKNYISEGEINITIERIKNNKKWYDNVVNQAKKRGLTIDKMLRKSAIYTIRNRKNSPKVY